MAGYQIYYIPMGTGNQTNYAWHAPQKLYDNVKVALGIKEADNNTKNLYFGINNPKPPMVRVNFEKRGQNNIPGGSRKVFCAPGKLGDALYSDALVGKKIGDKTIASVSSVR